MSKSENARTQPMSRPSHKKIPVIMLGTGGHAKVLLEILRRNGTKILGCVDPVRNAGEQVASMPVLGGDEAILDYPPEEVELVNGVGALPGKSNRWAIADRWYSQGYSFASIVDPSAILATNVELAEGVQIMAGAVIQPYVTVGRDTILNTSVSVDHDCTIGNQCHIAPGVTLSGEVSLGNRVHVGPGTVVIQGLTIGEGSVIGAGSVVVRDVGSNMKLIQHRNGIAEALSNA